MNAQAPVLLSLTVRITSMRSRTKKGCVAFGHRVDIERGINDRAKPVVVRVPHSLVRVSDITIGGIYELYGEVSHIRREHGSFAIVETTVDAQDLLLIRPSGSQVIQWLSDNIKGIREVKATKLWDALGERLYQVLDDADHEAIDALIPTFGIREGMFQRWAEDGDAKTLKFVQERRIPLELARKAIRFHGKNTISALTSDPYRLLSFSGDWAEVDEIATERFGVSLDDDRRLAAALEESLYRASANGHTCTTVGVLQNSFASLIVPHQATSKSLARALLRGTESGQFVCRKDDGEIVLHAPGTWLMERTCAEFVRTLLTTPEAQARLFEIDVDSELQRFEADERVSIGDGEFKLNSAQRMAVRVSYTNRVSIITGGAGVGKTTVLKALYKILDLTGRPRFQMALSGRATARMTEATGSEASTIAGFLLHVSDREMGPAPIIVVDEASMVDLLTFYRLVQKLPEQAQLILVGDPYQLPPIGAGLILHALCAMDRVPRTELIEVKRQAKGSVIPVVAKAIRDGAFPEFSSNETDGAVFLDCPDDQILPTVLRLYAQDRPGTQILCATKSCRFAGMDAINRLAHHQYAQHDQQLLLENPETGMVEQTGLCVDDLVVYTANDWGRNLQNGSLGLITEVFPELREVNVSTEAEPSMRLALGRATFEGVAHYILKSDVDALDYAFAITVHKAQGSQFRRVIVPVRKSRILDRTFVYTAATRAQVQVIFVGDVEAVRGAICRPPIAFSRRTALRSLLA